MPRTLVAERPAELGSRLRRRQSARPQAAVHEQHGERGLEERGARRVERAARERGNDYRADDRRRTGRHERRLDPDLRESLQRERGSGKRAARVAAPVRRLDAQEAQRPAVRTSEPRSELERR